MGLQREPLGCSRCFHVALTDRDAQDDGSHHDGCQYECQPQAAAYPALFWLGRWLWWDTAATQDSCNMEGLAAGAAAALLNLRGVLSINVDVTAD